MLDILSLSVSTDQAQGGFHDLSDTIKNFNQEIWVTLLHFVELFLVSKWKH